MLQGNRRQMNLSSRPGSERCQLGRRDLVAATVPADVPGLNERGEEVMNGGNIEVERRRGIGRAYRRGVLPDEVEQRQRSRDRLDAAVKAGARLPRTFRW